MAELMRCEHCGGKARLTSKQAEFIGQKYSGEKFIRHRIRAICCKCKSTGAPITTEPTSENVWVALRGEHSEFFAPYLEQAITAWNTRAYDAEMERLQQLVREKTVIALRQQERADAFEDALERGDMVDATCSGCIHNTAYGPGAWLDSPCRTCRRHIVYDFYDNFRRTEAALEKEAAHGMEGD